jgi:hypothetical protein
MNKMKNYGIGLLIITILGAVIFKLTFTEERQNKISRSITSAFGTKEGCVELRSGGKLTFRFFHVEKLSTAYGTDDDKPRNYRYGYGIRDLNLDNVLSESEKLEGKKYFEVPDFSDHVYYDASLK